MTTESNKSISRPIVKRVGSFLLLVLGLIIVLFIMISLGLLMVESISGKQLKNINESIDKFGFYMQFVRWLLYLLIYFYWRSLIKFFGKIRHWEESVIDRALMSHNFTLIIILLVELFLIQSIHISIYQDFTHI